MGSRLSWIDIILPTSFRPTTTEAVEKHRDGVGPYQCKAKRDGVEAVPYRRAGRGEPSRGQDQTGRRGSRRLLSFLDLLVHLAQRAAVDAAKNSHKTDQRCQQTAFPGHEHNHHQPGDSAINPISGTAAVFCQERDQEANCQRPEKDAQHEGGVDPLHQFTVTQHHRVYQAEKEQCPGNIQYHGKPKIGIFGSTRVEQAAEFHAENCTVRAIRLYVEGLR